MPTTWQDQVLLELQAARDAARENLPGRSRVCARRAAGFAIREFYGQSGKENPPLNFLDLLVKFGREPALPDGICTAARHLVQRVDQEHNLPRNIDLVADAENLIHYISDIIDHRKIEG